MSQIKFQQLEEETSNERKIEELDFISSEFKGKKRNKCNRYSQLGRVEGAKLGIDFDKKYLGQRLSIGSRSKNKMDKNGKIIRGSKLRKLKCKNFSCRGLGQLINGNRIYKASKQSTMLQNAPQQSNSNFRISQKQNNLFY